MIMHVLCANEWGVPMQWGFTPLMRAIAVKQPVVVAALLNARRPKVDIHKARPVCCCWTTPVHDAK